MIKKLKKLYSEENPCFRNFKVYLLLPFYHFFTFNISIIKFCYFSFFHLVDKQSVERTQGDQAVKEIRNKGEPFIATYEWQDVEEGQPIPPALYVRMNLQTGKTEARLERNESKKDKAENGETLSNHQKYLERESLEVMLHHCNFF